MAQRWDADEAVTQLFAAHYTGLVRLATLLVGGRAEAEEIVQDAFVAMHGKWRRLREPEKALAYLRRAVVNRAHSLGRHRAVAAKHLRREAESPAPTTPSAEDRTVELESRAAMIAALQGLPNRQREVLVLRYYSDLSEQDIAAALGISRGAVKSHASRGIQALRASMEELT